MKKSLPPAKKNKDKERKKNFFPRFLTTLDYLLFCSLNTCLRSINFLGLYGTRFS